MTITDEEKDKLMQDIKKAFLEEVKKRAIERMFSTFDSRLEHYYAECISKMSPDVEKEFPL